MVSRSRKLRTPGGNIIGQSIDGGVADDGDDDGSAGDGSAGASAGAGAGAGGDVEENAETYDDFDFYTAQLEKVRTVREWWWW